MALGDLARQRPGHGLHGCVEQGCIGHAHEIDAKLVAKRPAGIVIRMLLRIVRRPVLSIEEDIGNA